MKTQTQDMLIRILRAELTGETVEFDGDPTTVLALAKRHQMEHVIAHALLQKGQKEFAKPLHQSIWMSEQQTFVLDRVREAFNAHKIPFIPLKGSVLRTFYPEEWMRNGCDIDILIRQEDIESAKTVLEHLGCVDQKGKSAHDITFKAGAVCMELHYTLIEDYRLPQIAGVLDRVWDYAEPVDGFEYAMSDEMFYFYHVAHMVKHFENGGCGVRPFMDLWVLQHRKEYSLQKREELLLQGGILTFAKAAVSLSEYWFSGTEMSGFDGLEEFVFNGGAYGSTANSVAVQHSLRGGRWGHIYHRLFVPSAQLKEYYPVLKKHPYLLPVYQVVRWVQALRRRKRYVREFSTSMRSSDLNGKTASILKELELLP